jgi:hypothetical protein
MRQQQRGVIHPLNAYYVCYESCETHTSHLIYMILCTCNELWSISATSIDIAMSDTCNLREYQLHVLTHATMYTQCCVWCVV